MSKNEKPFSIEVTKPGLSETDRLRIKGEEPVKVSREEYKRKKELEEQRKLGNAPAEVDEDGKDINPHIPQYISTVPWYVDRTQRASLKHQRVQEVKHCNELNEWYNRGTPDAARIATEFRKGACENCGSMGHKKKDCLERPRKKGAKFTNMNIAPDDLVQPHLKLDFEGKRDRWNGYDPNDHQEVIDEYAKLEVAKQIVKANKLNKELLTGETGEDKSLEEEKVEDEDKYADKIDMPGTNFDSKHRITVRNLRIREDTAKYLRNLDPNSAHYDPKTRSMRMNPYEMLGKLAGELEYAGDNFVRYSGDARSMASTQMFAWQAEERGQNVHLQADPTRLELMHRHYKGAKTRLVEERKSLLLEKYGGIEHLEAPPRELLFAQTEIYVEYSRSGKVIKGRENAVTKSKYNEEVRINNHTTCWGSFWKDGLWGYKCCQSTIRLSYCVGLKNENTGSEKKRSKNTDVKLENNTDKTAPTWQQKGSSTALSKSDKNVDVYTLKIAEEKSLVEQHRENTSKRSNKKKHSKNKKSKHKKKRKRKIESSSSDSSDSDLNVQPASKKFKNIKKFEFFRQRFETANKSEKKRNREVDLMNSLYERIRPYNSNRGDAEAAIWPTEAEMEAYREMQKNRDYPMYGL